jgi:hypothetical protein
MNGGPIIPRTAQAPAPLPSFHGTGPDFVTSSSCRAGFASRRRWCPATGVSAEAPSSSRRQAVGSPTRFPGQLRSFNRTGPDFRGVCRAAHWQQANLRVTDSVGQLLSEIRVPTHRICFDHSSTNFSCVLPLTLRVAGVGVVTTRLGLAATIFRSSPVIQADRTGFWDRTHLEEPAGDPFLLSLGKRSPPRRGSFFRPRRGKDPHRNAVEAKRVETTVLVLRVGSESERRPTAELSAWKMPSAESRRSTDVE